MKAVIGLGNPGDKYENTRHNVGFMSISAIAQKHNIDGKNISKFNSIVGKGLIGSEEVLLIQPLTYMNLSGEAVQKILHWYKIELKDILVIFDDINIDIGKMKFKKNGSDGGHNGIKSIIQHSGNNKNFARLKLGIGPDPGGHLRKNFVLQKFSKTEKETIEKIVEISVQAVEDFLDRGVEEAQNKYNNTLVQ